MWVIRGHEIREDATGPNEGDSPGQCRNPTERPASAFGTSLDEMTDNAQSPEHSLFRALRPLLTPERLAPYVKSADGNEKLALQLYQWNIELAGATHEALHVFEIVLRNAIDSQLAAWNTTQIDDRTGQPHGTEWLLDPAPLLRRLVRQSELDAARSRAERAVRHHGRAPLHGDLLAQLSMGTWRFLLPDRDPGRRYLWDHAISNAFPNLDRPVRSMVAAVDGVYRLRNRVAHLEPLLRSASVREQYTNMRSTLGAIDDTAEQWFVSIQRVTSILRSRPSPPSKR